VGGVRLGPPRPTPVGEPADGGVSTKGAAPA